jgi:hypothetical protein
VAFLVIGTVALLTVLLPLWRAIASDGYGVRPPPRSHHDVDELDNRGMPTKYAALR